MNREKIEEAVKLFLEGIGDDPERPGVVETPARVANMCAEIFAGMQDDPENYLKFFDTATVGSPVIVRDIPFYSVCEHHLLPFFGKVSVLYVPKGDKVIGLSKIARIVGAYAKRPQIQEQMTNGIADFLYSHLDASCVAVYAEAEHLCMSMRGVRADGAKTQTVAVRGDITAEQAFAYLK